MTTDTSEKGLETLIMRHMTGVDGLAARPHAVAEPPAPYGGTGYIAGRADDYDRAHGRDLPWLFVFARVSQPGGAHGAGVGGYRGVRETEHPKRASR